METRDPLFDLAGHVAVVTGASSDVGERFARVLRERGAELVLAGRRAHPRLCSILLGIRSIDELEKDPPWLDVAIPDELWAELKHEGLLREDAPTPRSSQIESRYQ